jgi:DHA1 family multidrug resistance protein-like MFS transporter
MKNKKSEQKPRKSNRYILTLLFLTMFIVMVGFGIIMPILPYYAESMGASATELGLLTALYAGLQFIFAPFWGRVSDRIGRRPVLLLGLIGFSLTFIGFGLSTRLWMLYLSRGISGLITSATLPTVMAYIADTTEKENRGNGMSILGAAMGLGMIFGPVIGGFLGEYSPSTPFFFSAGLALTIALFAVIFLPESLSETARATARLDKRRRGVLDVLRMLKGPLGFLLILALLTSFGMAQMESTSALFYERKFGAGEAEMGFIFMVMGVISFLAQFLLVGRAIKYLGEKKIIKYALLGVSIAFVVYPLISNITSAMIVVAIMGFSSSFLRPALNTLVSNQSSASEQGVAMGVANSYYSLGRMFGPVTGGIIFDYMGLNMPFYFAAVVNLTAFSLSFLFLRAEKQPVVQSLPHTAGE